MAGSIHIMQLIIKSDHWQTLWTVWTAPASMTAVCQCCFTTNCTGSTSVSECSTSLQWPTDHSPVSPESSTDVPHRLLCSSLQHCWSPAPAIRQPPSTDCSVFCSTFGCRFLLLLVLPSGIHCLTICAIRLLGQTSFDRIWNPTCLPVVSV